MRKKIIGVSAACLICATTFGASAVLSSASSSKDITIGSAGITAALDNYYENTSTPEANIMALLNPTVAQAAVVNATTDNEDKKQSATEETNTTDKKQTSDKSSDKKTNKKSTSKNTSKNNKKEEKSFYDSIAVSQVTDYVNVRKKPTTESEIVGKIYNNCAATIIKKTGDWYKIESGNVKGYIKSEFFITGDEAEAKAIEIGHVTATVTCPILNVREGQGTDSTLLTQLPQGGVFDVIKYGDGWVYLNVDGDVKGWVSMEFVTIDVKFDTAITLKEEADKIAEEERKAREAAEAEEAARQAEAEAEAARQAALAQQAANEAAQQQAANEAAQKAIEKAESSSAAAKRQAVVAYALQFVGNPYVYGGNSLTNGTDCSGFTKLVYANFGYNLNRVSSDQQYNGTAVDINNLQPGDILLYSNGGYAIGHAAIYIGNGQIVNASTESTGIIVSNAYYRTPACARRIIN